MTDIEHQDISNEIPNDDTLILAHVIFRHGERNVVNTLNSTTYPNDPYKDEIHWPGGFGQLTKEGKRQQYKLGLYLRRRYGKILDVKYSPNNIYVQSTDFDRTLMSAQANLAGLFPPIHDDEKWHDDIKWHPIPVHTIPWDMDHVLTTGRHCPAYEYALKKNMNESPEVQRIYTEYADHFLSWSQNSGATIATTIDVFKLQNTLVVEKEHNKKLPEWAEKAIESNGIMDYIAKFHMKLSTDTPLLARLKSGFLIRKIFDCFTLKMNSTLKPDRSLFLYSAHDVTIANLLNSLGLFELHFPPYASSVHLELYKTADDQYYVQVFYRKCNEEHPKPLNVPGCGSKFSVQQFLDHFKEIIPENDFETECRLQLLSAMM